MIPFTDQLPAQLTKTLAGSLVGATGRRLRRVLADSERQSAPERCCEAGIVGLLRTASSDGEAELAHLSDVIRAFFTADEIADDLGRAAYSRSPRARVRSGAVVRPASSDCSGAPAATAKPSWGI